jgi:PhnB protein
VYVPDSDATYARAMAAGATSLRAPQNEFYGDRMSGVQDPLGNQWYFATHVEDVSEEEMARRAAEEAAQAAPASS